MQEVFVVAVFALDDRLLDPDIGEEEQAHVDGRDGGHETERLGHEEPREDQVAPQTENLGEPIRAHLEE